MFASNIGASIVIRALRAPLLPDKSRKARNQLGAQIHKFCKEFFLKRLNFAGLLLTILLQETYDTLSEFCVALDDDADYIFSTYS